MVATKKQTHPTVTTKAGKKATTQPPTSMTSMTLATPAPVQELEHLLADNRLLASLKDKKTLVKLTDALRACAALDHESDLASASLGKFCYDVLYRDPN